MHNFPYSIIVAYCVLIAATLFSGKTNGLTSDTIAFISLFLYWCRFAGSDNMIRIHTCMWILWYAYFQKWNDYILINTNVRMSHTNTNVSVFVVWHWMWQPRQRAVGLSSKILIHNIADLFVVVIMTTLINTSTQSRPVIPELIF